MALKIRKIQTGGFYEYCFFCPGCRQYHGIRTEGWPEPDNLSERDKRRFRRKWEFDGNFESPTIVPSVRTRENDEPEAPTICHCFVEEGKIRYLADSVHHLSGKTVEMLEED